MCDYYSSPHSFCGDCTAAGILESCEGDVSNIYVGPSSNVIECPVVITGYDGQTYTCNAGLLHFANGIQMKTIVQEAADRKAKKEQISTFLLGMTSAGQNSVIRSTAGNHGNALLKELFSYL